MSQRSIRHFSRAICTGTPADLVRLSSSSSLSPALFYSRDAQEEEARVKYYSHCLQRCTRTYDLHTGRSLHGALCKDHAFPSSIFLQNCLLNMYFKCGDILLALRLFDEMPQRNVVSWSVTITGLVHCRQPSKALGCYKHMQVSGVRPNEFTLVGMLNACAVAEEFAMAYQVYCQVVKLGFVSNVYLMNAFLTAMIRSGKLTDAVELFESHWDKDVVSWNSMVAGFLQLSYSEVWRFWSRMIQEGVRPDEFTFSTVLTGLAEVVSLKNGKQVHAQLVKYGYRDDSCVGDSLVDMYLKSHELSDGLRAFEEMPWRDVVSWTQMASGCLHCGEPVKALELLKKMMQMQIVPNKFTLATYFSVCSNLVSLEEGVKAHGLRIKLGSTVDSCVDNALLDMYAKCGNTDTAWRVFQVMKERSTVSWTTMIMGFAQNGKAEDALRVFDKMISENIQPNGITYICVLYACSQGGFVDQGWGYFSSMTDNHGIIPVEDHYTCMVDLLGRAGRIAEARDLIESMPFQPGVLIWQTLLGACRMHGDVEVGKLAAEKALSHDRQDSSTYILLHNMFASSSSWDGARWVRSLIKDSKVERMPGRSWIEVMDNRFSSLL